MSTHSARVWFKMATSIVIKDYYSVDLKNLKLPMDSLM
jgi:hypothetical protein